MTRPVLSTFGRELYEDRVGPLTALDEQHGWATAILVCAVASMVDPIEFVRDDADGPGFSALLDVDRAPADGLGWLSMFAGVRLIGGTVAEQRLRIDDTDGFNRGTAGAIVAAAPPTLTGNKRVTLIERDGSAYRLRVVTYAAETPDAAATNRALQAQKPVGLILVHEVRTGQVWSELVSEQASWTSTQSSYATWQAVIDKIPT